MGVTVGITGHFHTFVRNTEGVMKTLLIVSDHDREFLLEALMHVGCVIDAMSIRTPDDLCTLRPEECSYDLAVVQVYHGDPTAPPKKLVADDAKGLDAIRAVVALFPHCPILAITDSRIAGDAQLAFDAGADWFQSIDWVEMICPTAFMRGQIQHAKERRSQKLAATAA